MNKIIGLAISLFLPLPCFADTIHIPADYATIQEGINAAEEGDTVLVAPGTYFENINIHGDSINLISEAGPYVTCLDGSRATCVIDILAWPHDQRSLISGFTITNGSGNYIAKQGLCGGGIYSNWGSPVITNNIITGNKISSTTLGGGGGGIYCYDGEPVIENNIIAFNEVDCGGASGGGIECYRSAVTIRGNLIAQNSVVSASAFDGKGGGIRLYICDAQPISSNVIVNNYATEYGGGLDCHMSDGFLSLVDNIIAYNTAGEGGGGIICRLKTTTTFTNNTFFGNTAPNGGACYFDNLEAVFDNTLLWGNEAVTGKEIYCQAYTMPYTIWMNHCDVEGGLASVYLDPANLEWGPGMIDKYPLFIDPSALNFHLAYASPCRNAGYNAAPRLPLWDYEGELRIGDGIADIGADECHTHRRFTKDESHSIK